MASQTANEMQPTRPRLLVLGTGFGAFSLLKEIDVKRYDVRIVSPRNHFLFTPLLPSTTVGTLEFRSIIEPIRVARKGARYYQAACVGVDFDLRTVQCQDAFDETPFELQYDILVIAVGSVNNTFGVPGVLEYALFLKELADARAIRQKLLECFEHASSSPKREPAELERMLRFVIVGGGPTGVEFAAELHDFVKEDLSRWFPDLTPYVRITLVDASKQILNTFDAALSEYTANHFQRAGIEVRTSSTVREVRKDTVVLHNGEEIHHALVVWSTGIGPSPLIKSIEKPKESFRRLLVDEYLQVFETMNVYALGDCAKVDGKDFPPTAQVAQQGGKYLGRALNQKAKGRLIKPFVYRHMGMLAYVGENKALADMKNLKGKGFSTWLFWRSAYLTKLVSTKNKILVLMNWMLTWIFGRDISRF